MRGADVTPPGSRAESSPAFHVAGIGRTEEQAVVIEVTFSTSC
jgi:hypothetical protein